MRKRGHVIPLRLTDQELAHLNRCAAASGLPREEYLRSLIMGKTITPRLHPSCRPAAQGSGVMQQCQSAGPPRQQHRHGRSGERGRDGTHCAGGVGRSARKLVSMKGPAAKFGQEYGGLLKNSQLYGIMQIQ